MDKYGVESLSKSRQISKRRGNLTDKDERIKGYTLLIKIGEHD